MPLSERYSSRGRTSVPKEPSIKMQTRPDALDETGALKRLLAMLHRKYGFKKEQRYRNIYKAYITGQHSKAGVAWLPSRTCLSLAGGRMWATTGPSVQTSPQPVLRKTSNCWLPWLSKYASTESVLGLLFLAASISDLDTSSSSRDQQTLVSAQDQQQQQQLLISSCFPPLRPLFSHNGNL